MWASDEPGDIPGRNFEELTWGIAFQMLLHVHIWANLHTCESNYLEVLPKYDHQITVKTDVLETWTLNHYVCTYLCEYHIIISPPSAVCDSWKNLSTAFQTDFSLDFCEIPELNSCGFHKLHACKQHTFERRLCGPFLLHAYVSVVIDWHPLWAIQWHFRTISLCRKPAVVFL